MDENSRVLSILGGIAISIVGFQICRKVLPWIYSNMLGPQIFGSSVNLAKMGDWAGKLTNSSINNAIKFARCL